MKTIKLLLPLFLVVFTVSLHSAENNQNSGNNDNDDDFYTIWLPGLHGGRADENSLLTTKHYKIYDVIMPASQADLGQEYCIRDLERQLQNDQDFQRSNKVIVIGSSQGAATWLNTIAKMPYTQQTKIAAIILEAPLADANDAIMQSAIKKRLEYFPFVRFWSPWIAKLSHPHYQPYGLQAIKSVKYIVPTIPIIIVHNKKDARISVNSARKLVCTLLHARKTHTHVNNVYYIETDIDAQHGDNHTNFLCEDAHSTAAFHTIGKNLKLPYNSHYVQAWNDHELKTFQPSIEQLEQAIFKDTWRDTYARNVIDVIALLVIIFAIYKLIKK